MGMSILPNFRGIGGEISQDGDFYVFEGNRYRGGFLYKTMATSAIVSYNGCMKNLIYMNADGYLFLTIL